MRGLVGTEPRTLACVMAKTKRVMIGAKIVERLVALPGMWDGLAAWRRGILKAAVPLFRPGLRESTGVGHG